MSANIRNKRRVKIVSTTIIFLLFEAALILLWRFSAYYPARMATEKNTRNITIYSPRVEYVSRRRNHYICVYDSNQKYKIILGITPNVGCTPREFAEKLNREPVLELAVSNGSGNVCAVSGAETEYFGIDGFNECQNSSL